MRFSPPLNKITHIFLYCSYLAVCVLILMEIAYRFQLIDFYRSELEALNAERDLRPDNDKSTILACGDSFTVQNLSWAHQLKSSLSDYRIINSAITGTSVVEASYLAPGRIRTFDPDIFIYQIYVGNDLLGVKHRLNWKDWSVIRNIYWGISDRVHVVSYFNYKMGQLGWNFSRNNQIASKGESQFDPKLYAIRDKIIAQGDPFLVSNSVLLKGKRDEDIKELLTRLTEVISELRPDCKVYLLVIPHKSQIDSAYYMNMREIGFQFDQTFNLRHENYPFVEEIKTHFSSSSKIKVLNPLNALVQADSASGKVYFMNDEHLSKIGQSVVRDLVLNEIKNSHR